MTTPRNATAPRQGLAHVSVASNIAPQQNVKQALILLSETPSIQLRRVSPFYETEPIGRPEQTRYWNGVAAMTAADPDALVTQMRRIEVALGRVRTADRYAARTIDLDLLLWNGEPVGADAAAELHERPWLCWGLRALGVDVAPCKDAPAAPPPVATPWPL